MSWGMSAAHAASLTASAKGDRRRKAALVAAATVLLLCAAACAWQLLRAPAEADPLAADPNARAGTLSAQAVEVPAGSYRLVLNQQPVMAAGDATCPIRFENPEANGYDARLDLVLDEGGETLASTGIVSPGYYVEEVQLARALEAGSYAATARVTVLSGHRKTSDMAADVTIVVQ